MSVDEIEVNELNIYQKENNISQKRNEQTSEPGDWASHPKFIEVKIRECKNIGTFQNNKHRW